MPLLCQVNSVTGMTCNVTPVNGDAPVNDVRLIANADAQKYFVLIPKIGSNVIVMFLSKASAFVVMADEVEKIIYKSGDVVFDVDAAGFLLKKQNEDLKALMSDLIDGIVNASYVTSNGPTTGMVPASSTVLNGIKTRFNNLLK